VDELQGGLDHPPDGDRPVPCAPETDGKAARLPQAFEARTRSEYVADLKQLRVAGVPDRPFGERLDELPERGRPDVDSPGECAEPVETPRDVLKRFSPERAGLPGVSEIDASAYIEANYQDRPWLVPARACSPAVQRVFAALDQGGGHGHIRHEGWVTEGMNERRVQFLEDPAQLSPQKRAAGIDGIKEGDAPHRCRKVATRIRDSDAFAVAFARGVEHPTVQGALGTAFDPDRRPRPVSVPIESLLGPDGHEYCTGWRLEPAEGSLETSRRNRDAWVAARADGRASDVPQPEAEPLGTFEGGTIVFAFGPSNARDGYEIVTMYPRPHGAFGSGERQ
jgi:hypothetical protein